MMLREIEAWRAAGTRFALARVLATWGSSPCQPGSAMLISEQGKVIGSVSSGCVESDLIERALEVLAAGRGRRISYGVADEKAWAVGLSCGGQLEVWVEPFWGNEGEGAAVWQAVLASEARNAPVTLVSRLRPEAGPPMLLEGMPAAEATALGAVAAAWPGGQSGLAAVGEEEVFLHRLEPRSRVIMLGAGQIAVALVRYLEILGMEILLVDPRAIFTDPDRFVGSRAAIVTAWPQEALPGLQYGPQDYVVLLTHDPRIDLPALEVVLRQPVAYIGALGSRKSHQKRREKLAEMGFSAAEIDRIQGPVGLPLGGRSTEEIALSIAAEIVAVRNGAWPVRMG